MIGTPEKPAGEFGWVLPRFERGAALLRSEAGKVYRLSWDLPPKQSGGLIRALPAGKYDLIGYRIVKEDGNGTPWHVSATGTKIAELNVSPGGQHWLPIDSVIRIRDRVNRGQVQMEIRGIGRAGLSIYKGSKRIPVSYRVLDAAAKVVQEGPITYG